jgi:CheY-like chemotaxis protein
MEIATLIVDDQADMRLLMKMVVDAANDGLFVKRTVASGAEALDVVDDVDPAIIVLDEMMPGMSGVETAELLRQRRPGQLMIMCTAYLDEELRARAAAAGIKVCMSKDKVNDMPEILRRVAASVR